MLKRILVEHTHDIFYDVNELSLNKKVKIIKDAFAQNYKWWVDILDCSVSWARQNIDLTFEEIMDKFSDKAHFVIIHRKGFHHDRGFPDPGDKHGLRRWHLEVGFRSHANIAEPDYYLWIYVSEDKVEKFVKKYDLQILNAIKATGQ